MSNECYVWFDPDGLETIHNTVSRWAERNGYGIAAPQTINAVRRAFAIFQRNMDSAELTTLLHQDLTSSHQY